MATEDFELVVSILMQDKIPIKKFKSKSTGIRVVHGKVDGPLIRAFVVLATRAEDDLGLPHMLEHLIFMGSESYPYNGTLQQIAMECFANLPNAWTDIDHTCFTITATTVEGFLKIFPVFLDHIFFPALSDEAFLTEIYHVNESAEDAGVLYSEALAMESSNIDKGFQSLRRLMFPNYSSYHFNYRGSEKSIREKSNINSVREYHSQYYIPLNARIIVTGQIAEAELFKSLALFLPKLKTKSHTLKDWENPWEDELVPELEEDIEETILYPIDNEMEQEILVLAGFQGGNADIEFSTNIALRLLLEYLTGNSKSPLVSKFIENENPLARSCKFSFVESHNSIFYFQIEGVQSHKKSEIVTTLKNTLIEATQNFNLDTMKHLILKSEEEDLSALENNPHNCLAFLFITDFLFGDERMEEPLPRRVASFGNLKKYLRKPRSFWTDLLKAYILKPMAVVYMVPSKKEMDIQMADAKQRQISRSEKLGSEKLKQQGKTIQSAVIYNSRTIPPKYSHQSTIRFPSKIMFHAVNHHVNPKFPPGVRCNFYLDDIHSRFAYISVLMDTSRLSKYQRKFLPLYCLALTESGVRIDAHKVISSEEVWDELNRVFVNYNVSLGITDGGKFKCGNFSHLLCFNAQLELSKLGIGVLWLKRLFWNIDFQADRLKVLCMALLRDIMELQLDSEYVAEAMLRNLIYYTDSNVHVTCMIRQEKFLKELWNRPDDDAKLFSSLKDIMKAFNSPKNVTIHVATNLEKAKISYEDLQRNDFLFREWTEAVSFQGEQPKKKITNVHDKFWIRNENKLRTSPKAVIYGNILETNGFAYLAQCVPAINDFNQPQLPHLLVAIQYLTQAIISSFKKTSPTPTDADLKVSFDVKPNEGILYLYISQASDLVQTYNQISSTIVEHVSVVVPANKTGTQGSMWRENVFEEAKRTLIFETVEGQSTLLAVATNSLLSHYRNTPGQNAKKMTEEFTKVTLEQVKTVTTQYIQHLFVQPCNCAVVCPTDQVPVIIEGFSKFGKLLTVIPSISNSYMSRW